MATLGPRGETSAPEPTGHAIARINDPLEVEVSAKLVTEDRLEKWWAQARELEDCGPAYWLLLTRLAEATLLCAGNYADNCEFQAAGDLLVNPRQIQVHSLAGGRSTAKNRHGRLSEQFALTGAKRLRRMKLFSADMRLEVTQSPLLPHMTRFLKDAGCVSPAYLLRLEQGQRRIAETLVFLAAWGIFDSVAAVGGCFSEGEKVCRIQPVPVRHADIPSNRLQPAAASDGSGAPKSISGRTPSGCKRAAKNFARQYRAPSRLAGVNQQAIHDEALPVTPRSHRVAGSRLLHRTDGCPAQ
jgi:hypothetical protein